MTEALNLENRPGGGQTVDGHTEDGQQVGEARARSSEQCYHSQEVECGDAAPQVGRPDSKGMLLKTAVVVQDVITSSLIGLVVIAALPPAVGFGITSTSMVVAAFLAVGVGENTAVRILYGARRLTASETLRLAVPWQMVASRVDTDVIHLQIVTHGPLVAAAGRRHVLLAHNVVDAYRADRITDGEVAALIAHGIGRVRHGHTRFDLLWVFWTAPWDFIRGLVVGAGRHLAWIPLGRFAWKTRVIVGGIAVVLETQAGRWPSPIIIATFVAFTYLMACWRGSWEQQLTHASDRYVAQTGLGDELARFLRRLPRSGELANRIDRLTSSVTHTAP